MSQDFSNKNGVLDGDASGFDDDFVGLVFVSDEEASSVSDVSSNGTFGRESNFVLLGGFLSLFDFSVFGDG